LDIGLVGLPASGKTTLFTLLTGAPAGSRVGVAQVPDRRLDALAGVFRPRKLTPATIRLTDIPGFVPGRIQRSELHAFLEAVARTDALLHVVRAFDDPSRPHALDGVDPARDARMLEEELILADLDRAETVAARLAKNHTRGPEEEMQKRTLERCAAGLAEGVPVRRLGLGEEEMASLRGFALLTARSELLALNLGEEALRAGGAAPEALQAWCAERSIPLVPFCGSVEAEIAALPPAERDEFLAGYGIGEPGVDRLARAAYAALGLISFLTAGEDEVLAWPIRDGTDARRAAGRIHSDIEKGFIRAEVADWEELVAAGAAQAGGGATVGPGAWKALRDRGRLRLEGRDYTVRDGDVINFRFNV
jgi:GTP-binding protein YchF